MQTDNLTIRIISHGTSILYIAMKSTALFASLASIAIGFAAADELKIEKTQTVQCERKTVKGDMVSMHYHGTLADTGNKFDASAWPPLGPRIVGGS